jgi:hypothetical protein
MYQNEFICKLRDVQVQVGQVQQALMSEKLLCTPGLVASFRVEATDTALISILTGDSTRHASPGVQTGLSDLYLSALDLITLAESMLIHTLFHERSLASVSPLVCSGEFSTLIATVDTLMSRFFPQPLVSSRYGPQLCRLLTS